MLLIETGPWMEEVFENTFWNGLVVLVPNWDRDGELRGGDLKLAYGLLD